MKRCSACKVAKPLTEFGCNRSKPGGLHDECRPCKKTSDHRRYLANRDKRIAQSRAWVLANPDARKAYVKRYYAENREELRVIRAAYRETHREELREYTRQWNKANRALRRIAAQRRRAAFAAVPVNDLTIDQWIEILAKFGHACAYCPTGTDLTMDHVVPISKGGSHTASNIVPACRRCNSSKGNRGSRPLSFAA